MAPQVRSYDVETYHVQPGDTSFADISQKVYRSESYGKALEKKGGFTKIIRLGADLATKSRNEGDG